MKHLLVIRLSALGDVAILAPVQKAYALSNPDVHFTVAAPPLLQPLFEGIPNVSFLGVKKKQSSRAIYKQLKAVGADAIADMHRVNRVNRALFWLQLNALLHLHPLRVRHIHKGRLSRWLFIHHHRNTPRKPQSERYADVFRRLGLNPPATSHRPPTTDHQPPITIGIAPFAQHKGKIWPFENTSKLALLLSEKGYIISLFGSKEEAQQLEELASKHPNITSLAGKQSFAEELEIIKNLSLMVTMDSANMHFASAVGTPVVSVWGATHPDFGFYGWMQERNNALCANMKCQPCSAYGNKPCRYGDYRCLTAITPEAVIDKIEKALQ